jgi:ABC-type multidrug transport system fused ATPase/permease subunit
MIKELDLLKKDWKKSENYFMSVSESAIYKMIHKKSSSIVKWILIISIMEVLLWSGISIFYNSDEYFKRIKNENLIDYFKYLTEINYVVVAVFIYIFYRNYRSISSITSIKQLMSDIMKTRKTVQFYVWYNLGIIVISMILGFVLVFNVDPKLHQLMSKNNAILLMIVFCTVCILGVVGLFWLFYRLIYGILLQKLYKNYNDLRNIDL